jgi:CDGSH-type Zn-finger protein
MTRPSVTLYRDGPYLLRGDVRILDENGEEIDAGRRTVALCRCGRTRTAPFCDGTHNRGRFRAPATGRPAVGRGDAGPGSPPA